MSKSRQMVVASCVAGVLVLTAVVVCATSRESMRPALRQEDMERGAATAAPHDERGRGRPPQPAETPAAAFVRRAVREDGTPLAGSAGDAGPARAVPGKDFLVWFVGPTSEFTARPDASGEFRAPPETGAGEFRLMAWSPSAPATTLRCDRTFRADGPDGDFVFREPPRGRIDVRCRDEAGAGVKAVAKVVRVLPTDTVAVGTVTTDVAGYASFEASAGDYEVSLESAATRAIKPRRAQRLRVAVSETPVLASFEIPAPAALDVEVSEADGTPVAGALVSLKFAEDGVWRCAPTSGRSTDGGEFSFHDLAPGQACVQVTRAGFEPYVAPVTLSGRRSLSVELRPGGRTVRGRLASLDYSNLPANRRAPSKWMSYVVRRGATPSDVMAVWSVSVADDGSFVASGLPAGECEIHFNEPGFFVLVNVDASEIDMGELDASAVAESGDSAARVAVELPEGPQSAPVNYRRADWPRWLWRTKGVTQSAVLGRLVPGQYSFEPSMAGMDPSAFDLRTGVAADVVGDESSPTPVRLRIARR